MTRLVEHRAKSIVARHGLGVPPSVLCRSVAEAGESFDRLAASTAYVKAQVAVGDRLALGGIRRVISRDECTCATAALLGTSLGGFAIDEVLIEAGVDAERSFYVAFLILDHQPVLHGGAIVGDGPGEYLLFACRAGTGFDPATCDLAWRLPESEVLPHSVRTELADVGLSGAELLAAADVVRAVIEVARAWHVYVVELNPVLLTEAGPVVVDAKVDVDDYSSAMLPDSSMVGDLMSAHPCERAAAEFHAADHRGTLRYVQLVDEDAPVTGPLVGSQCVGGGESMVVIDALAAAGLTPANYCDTSGNPSQAKVAIAAELITSQPHIDAFFFCTCIANQPLSVTAAGLVEGLRRAHWRGPTVVRIAGNEEPRALEILGEWADTVGRDRVVLLGRDADEWEAVGALVGLLQREGLS